MSQITIDNFADAAAKFFEPIAKEHGWDFLRPDPDLYEISSPFFTMKIHFGVGHGKSISSTLKPTTQASSGTDPGRNEFGVAVIAAYNGVEMQTRPVSTVEDFVQQARYVADMARRFLIPYLLGEKSDFDKIRPFVDQKTKNELEQIENYKFPPNVQKRWHLPPQNKGTTD